LPKDPIKLVLVFLIIVFGFITFYISTKSTAGKNVSASSSDLSVVEIKPNTKASINDQDLDNNEVFLADPEEIMASEIKVLSDVKIKKAEYQKEFDNLSNLLMSARATPYRKKGSDEIVGFIFDDIQPKSIWLRFKVKDGDVLTKVNDTKLNSAGATLEMYEILKSLKKIKIEIIRDGKPGILMITVVD
jgi:hypothetical protein